MNKLLFLIQVVQNEHNQVQVTNIIECKSKK